jgi:hypothetical protein
MQDGGGGVADGVGGYRERPRDFLPLVRALGIHFQVRDDYVNLSSGAVRPRDVHVAPHLNLNAQHRLSLSLCVSLCRWQWVHSTWHTRAFVRTLRRASFRYR